MLDRCWAGRDGQQGAVVPEAEDRQVRRGFELTKRALGFAVSQEGEDPVVDPRDQAFQLGFRLGEGLGGPDGDVVVRERSGSRRLRVAIALSPVLKGGIAAAIRACVDSAPRTFSTRAARAQERAVLTFSGPSSSACRSEGDGSSRPIGRLIPGSPAALAGMVLLANTRKSTSCPADGELDWRSTVGAVHGVVGKISALAPCRVNTSLMRSFTASRSTARA